MRPTALLALALAPLLLSRGEKRAISETRPAGPLTVTPEWLATHQDDSNLVILEIGDEGQYRQGHIRRARPVDIMAFHAHGVGLPEASHFVPGLQALGISNSSTVVMYGQNMDTSLLWVLLEYLGLGDRALVLDGGKRAWTEAGKPLSTETPGYLAGKLVPHQRQDIFIDAPLITLMLNDPRLAIIDGRSAGEFDGTDAELNSPGHIPGAVNLDWVRTFDSTGKLLPPDQLRALFAAAGYAPGDQLVVYCTVGMRASHLYFVARHIGLTPLLYLGSMNDWVSDSSRPVERSAAR
jgi:thiosulfate/3-mercaptopyruvate sulfurtransferase